MLSERGSSRHTRPCARDFSSSLVPYAHNLDCILSFIFICLFVVPVLLFFCCVYQFQFQIIIIIFQLKSVCMGPERIESPQYST